MSENKIERKLRFLPYFPYGFCSQLATTIEGRTNLAATMLLLGDDPEQAIRLAKKRRECTVSKARFLVEKGYAKDVQYQCGIPKVNHSFRMLKKEGLAIFTEAPDRAAREEITEMVNDGNIKERYFRSDSLSAAEFRETLYSYALSDGTEDREVFTSLLLDAVIDGRVTPLSFATDLIEKAKISTSKYSANQLYNIWRLSHVNSMFRVNGHLTYLDRRPYDINFAVDGITNSTTHEIYLEKYGYTTAAVTYHALTNWYKRNPGFYQITQQYPDESAEAKETWLHTPAFYSALEIPNLNDKEDISLTGNAHGSQQKIYSVHIGLCIGKKVNYLCYHGKPGTLSWVVKREQQAKAETERAIRHMKTLNPEMPNADSVNFALYFCSSYHQFLSLFDRTIERHKRGLRGNFLTDAPFAGLHAIPVNDSGTFLLWCLAEYSPVETEDIIRNSLVNRNVGFEYQVNRLYPLTYKGKRVFLGYTMDVAKINRVLEDHLDGQDFYICCFPEQAPWYQKLFPGKTIL